MDKEAKKVVDELNKAKDESVKAIADVAILRNEMSKQYREAQEQILKLARQKKTLLSDIKLKQDELESLSSERNQLKTQLEKREEESAKLDSLLEANHGLLIGKLSELSTAVDAFKDPSASEQISGIAYKLQELQRTTPASAEDFQQSIGQLEAK
jgi:chromosome segregation ATPase